MEFDKYQSAIVKYDLGVATKRVSDPDFVDKILGLVGEAGEAADKFKKIIRDKQGEMSEDDKQEIVKELGDVLWYIATIARYMGVSLDDIAEGNISKLQSRYERGKIGGHGDNR